MLIIAVLYGFLYNGIWIKIVYVKHTCYKIDVKNLAKTVYLIKYNLKLTYSLTKLTAESLFLTLTAWATACMVISM